MLKKFPLSYALNRDPPELYRTDTDETLASWSRSIHRDAGEGMGIKIDLKDLNRMDDVRQIDRRPDVWPLCHHAMEFLKHEYASYNAISGLAQLVYRCQKINCQNLFFANYMLNPKWPSLLFEFQPNQPCSEIFHRTYQEHLQRIQRGLRKVGQYAKW